MTDNVLPQPHWTGPIVGRYLRFAAGGAIPAKWYLKSLPVENNRQAKTGSLHIEIVSHCWNYSHLLAYQLSSLVNFPPENTQVTMTVFYCDEDADTVALLDFFALQDIHNVTWNWQPLPKEQLFRRSIGRNIAAKQSLADWVWFTDCDVLFNENCFASLSASLQSRRDTLVFPRQQRVTSLLSQDDPMLSAGAKPRIVSAPTEKFQITENTRATGPLQITHGDVARACGYCESLPYYQTPSPVWCKAYEDRAFRWLLRTKGVPMDIEGVYRIRHVEKGRYTGSSVNTGVRSRIRRLKSWFKES